MNSGGITRTYLVGNGTLFGNVHVEINLSMLTTFAPSAREYEELINKSLLAPKCSVCGAPDSIHREDCALMAKIMESQK